MSPTVLCCVLPSSQIYDGTVIYMRSQKANRLCSVAEGTSHMSCSEFTTGTVTQFVVSGGRGAHTY